MKITEVIYENWGPYFGQQSLDINVSKNSRVIVVHGDNGNGKTKLIDGLKWVFAGGQHGLVKVGPYISLQAIQSNKPFDTAVSVRFRQGSNEFLLRRSIKFDPTVFSGSSAENIRSHILNMPDKSRVHLEKIGGESYNAEQTTRVMERLFPARLVGFYFFDAAKLLDSFGSVSGGQNSAGGLSLKISVEMAMGLRGLDAFSSELSKLELNLRDQSVQDSKNRDLVQKLLAELRSGETGKEQALIGLATARETLANLQNEKLELNSRLSGAQGLIDAQSSRNRLQFELDSLANSERVLKSRLPSLAKALWMAPMARTLRTEQTQIKTRSEGRSNRIAQALFLQQQIAYFEQQSNSTVCLACGQETIKGAESHASNLDDLRSQLAGINADPEVAKDRADSELESLLNNVMFSDVIKHRLQEFSDYKFDVERIALRRIELRDELEQLSLVFGDFENADLLSVNDRYLEVERLISEVKKKINSEISAVEDFTSAVARAKLKLNKLGSTDSDAMRKLAKVQKLNAVIEKVSKQLRQDVRQALKDEANSIFAEIRSSSDANFEVDLDEDYRLSTSKHNPNAAYMQQVFLSFLFAIPRVAQAPFPVVIDSPIQHLDVGNRKRFIEWCKDGLSQLVLLPHDGEIEPYKTKEMFGESLSRHFVISHDETNGQSSFEVYGGRV